MKCSGSFLAVHLKVESSWGVAACPCPLAESLVDAKTMLNDLTFLDLIQVFLAPKTENRHGAVCKINLADGASAQAYGDSRKWLRQDIFVDCEKQNIKLMKIKCRSEFKIS